MVNKADGAARVVGDLVTGAARALAADRAPAEQMPLFPVPTRFTGARGEHLARAIEHQRRAAGRPAGSLNKSTAALRDWLLARGVLPQQRLMEVALHTPTSLAAELGCTRLEALRELRATWAELAPYFMSKLAPTDGAGQAVPTFLMQIGAGPIGAGPGAAPPWARDPRRMAESETDQGLSDAAPIDAASEGAARDG